MVYNNIAKEVASVVNKQGKAEVGQAQECSAQNKISIHSDVDLNCSKESR